MPPEWKTMNCSFIFDGYPCGSEAALVHSNFAVCLEHLTVVEDRQNGLRRITAIQASKHHPVESFPGLCYIVLLPTGHIKIGYSNTEELLRKRMIALKSEYKLPPVKLATLQGGFVMEAVLHSRFHPYRVPGPGERFHYSPEIAEFIASVQ